MIRTLLAAPTAALAALAVTGLAATGAPLEGRMLAHASGRYGVTVLEEGDSAAIADAGQATSKSQRRSFPR